VLSFSASEKHPSTLVEGTLIVLSSKERFCHNMLQNHRRWRAKTATLPTLFQPKRNQMRATLNTWLLPKFFIYTMPMDEARWRALFQTTMSILITLRLKIGSCALCVVLALIAILNRRMEPYEVLPFVFIDGFTTQSAHEPQNLTTLRLIYQLK